MHIKFVLERKKNNGYLSEKENVLSLTLIDAFVELLRLAEYACCQIGKVLLRKIIQLSNCPTRFLGPHCSYMLQKSVQSKDSQ